MNTIMDCVHVENYSEPRQEILNKTIRIVSAYKR